MRVKALKVLNMFRTLFYTDLEQEEELHMLSLDTLSPQILKRQ